MPDIQEMLASQFPDLEIETLENATPAGFRVPVEPIVNICRHLHENPATYFDHLACLGVIDHGPEANEMEVSYVLYSIPHDLHLTLQIVLDRAKPEAPSVTPVWKGADWHEREAFDLYGVRFTGHPDLRRILMPADWDGYPMRKDYDEAAAYHGMTIKHPDLLKEKS